MEAYFDGRAAGYGQLDWHTGYAERLVALAGLASGMRVLDAATGTGLAALAAARVVGPPGEVVGVDISAGMLQEADHLLAASGLANVTYVKADVTTLDEFEDESFDAVLCCAGMLYLSAGPALSAWHRVLRPSGLLGFSAMRAGFPVAARVFRECAASFGLALPDPMAEVGTEKSSREAVSRAGFVFERAVPGVIALPPRNAADLWRGHALSPNYPELASLTSAELAALESSYVARVSEVLSEPGTFDLPVMYVYARKP
ncbi:methyltransferase domain-containing protein [Planotetraspora sp. A-T 1434]|uniref:class I SAM-dependent methyltransferase n=1 Tax=Planotetraspora sp. A-T 1434 TaxID=2979219 RepID=UPI0021C21F09|nr:class I SAM-dependent methyltransferase [Planotetraspora sp. A-T 1434]MCT9931504.1 methyltransferase domain-containing protein [Planotetraspora sp. A-T 1434]